MKKIALFLLFAVICVSACDLQPKITALPDTVGDFITARYPALLADPNTQPEIYNSAATDYGVYAAPELYGTGATTEDYVLYASVDDYIVPPDDTADDTSDTNTDVPEETPNVDDTLVVGERIVEAEPKPENESESDGETEAPWTPTNDVLDVPKYMYGGHNVTEITVARGDTLYAIGAKYGMKVDEIAKLNNMSEPYTLRIGQKLQVRASREQVVTDMPKISEPKPAAKAAPKPTAKPATTAGRATTTRVELNEITVAPGDTLYSLSRKYSIPVNDLAVMNNLSVPFALYAGQKVRVPNLAAAPVRALSSVTPVKIADAKAVNTQTKTTETKKSIATKTTTTKADTKTNTKDAAKNKATESGKQATDKKQQKQAEQKQTKQASTNSIKKLPAIAARSSSRFSWPVRGKILSNYGAKNNGLFNDGINIAAARGATVAAAENGVVAYSGNEVKGMGNLIIIQHSDGWMTVYAHMDSLGVRRGARVRVGQKIGTVGQTGKVNKPQLHFEIRRGTKAYNPIQYLKK